MSVLQPVLIPSALDPLNWAPGGPPKPHPFQKEVALMTGSSITTLDDGAFLISTGNGSFTVSTGNKAVTITEEDKTVTVDHERFASTVLQGRKLQITNRDISVTVDTGGKDVLDIGGRQSDCVVSTKKPRHNLAFFRAFCHKPKKDRGVKITAGYKNVTLSIEDVSATIIPGNRAVAIAPGKGAVKITSEGEDGHEIPGVETLTIYPNGGIVTLVPSGGSITVTLGEGEVTILHEGGNKTTAREPNSSILGGRVINIDGEIGRFNESGCRTSLSSVRSEYRGTEPSQKSKRAFFSRFWRMEDHQNNVLEEFFISFHDEIETAAKTARAKFYDLLNEQVEEDKPAVSKVVDVWINHFESIERILDETCVDYSTDGIELVHQLQRLRDGEKVVVNSKVLFKPMAFMNKFKSLVLDLVDFRRRLVDERDPFEVQALYDPERPAVKAASASLYAIVDCWAEAAIIALEDHEKQFSGQIEMLSAEYFRLLDQAHPV